MADIIHRVGIKATPAQVYSALSTVKGLANWWTQETEGNSNTGEKLEFKFRNEDGSMKGEMHMEVQKLDPSKSVSWKVTQGPPDWIGTQIVFDLKQEGDFTILLFGHKNWESASESMAHCSTKWGVFLLSLRDYIEKGKGQPYPFDVKIDNWN